MRRLALLASLLLLCGLGAPTPAAERVDLLVRDATVVDVANGRLQPHRTLAIRDGRIVAVASGRQARRYAAGQVIDARGRYAIPGLWDMHVHFGGGEALAEENRNLLPLYVAHGITAVRDCAGDLSEHVLAWRAAVARGELLGPTIFTSGPKIEGIGSIWPGDLEVGSEAELEAALDKLQAWNVDFVKITDNALSPELFLAAVRSAQARGLRTSAHIPYALTLEEASDAGLDSIEHMDYAFKAGSPREKSIGEAVQRKELDARAAWSQWNSDFDMTRAMQVYRHLAKNGTAITPTLNGSRIVAWLDQDDHHADDYLRYIGPGLQATYAWRIERAAKDDAAAIQARHARFEKTAALLPKLRAAGMTILAGTDAGFLNSFNYPGIGLHDELGLLVRYGLTPAQALRAATLDNARWLGHGATHGTLAPGKVADVVLLDADPLRDIAATRRIRAVVLRGHAYDRAALDAMLADVAKKVAAQRAAAVSAAARDDD